MKKLFVLVLVSLAACADERAIDPVVDSGEAQLTNGLSFLTCNFTATSTTPTVATVSCDLFNVSAFPITINYLGPNGGATRPFTVSGPSGTCLAGAKCGTVTATSGSKAGLYAGSIAVSTTNGTAYAAVSLTVLGLTFGESCRFTATATAPNAASASCPLYNTAPTPVTIYYYSSPGGYTISGPVGTCGASSTCGTVTISAYSSVNDPGTFYESTSRGDFATAPVSLTVLPAVGTLSYVSGSLNGIYGTVRIKNTGAGTISNIRCQCYSYGNGYVSGCPSSLAPNTEGVVSIYYYRPPPSNHCTLAVSGTNATNSPFVMTSW